MRVKPKTAFCVVKNGELSIPDIYTHKDVRLYVGEILMSVIIIPTKKYRPVIKKEKSCLNCGKELSFYKRRWCSDLCQREHIKKP